MGGCIERFSASYSQQTWNRYEIQGTRWAQKKVINGMTPICRIVSPQLPIYLWPFKSRKQETLILQLHLSANGWARLVKP